VGVQFSSMSAIEIFDSRGRRTLAVSVTLAGGRRVRSCVPFGASIGSRGAVALYGHDDKRCAGISVRRGRSSVSPDLREHIRAAWASSGVSRAPRRTVNEIPKTPNWLDWQALNRH
jgi:enolase